MTAQAAQVMLESAWSARRASFDLPENEQRAALESVRDDLERAADMLRDSDHVALYAHALHLGAHVAMDVGDTDAAGVRWRRAVDLLRASGEPLQLAQKLRHLGDLEMSRSALDEAVGYYSEALDLYREHAAPGDLSHANAVRGSAVLSERRGEIEKARARWAEARERYAELGVLEGVDEADGRLEELGGLP